MTDRPASMHAASMMPPIVAVTDLDRARRLHQGQLGPRGQRLGRRRLVAEPLITGP